MTTPPAFGLFHGGALSLHGQESIRFHAIPFFTFPGNPRPVKTGLPFALLRLRLNSDGRPDFGRVGQTPRGESVAAAGGRRGWACWPRLEKVFGCATRLVVAPLASRRERQKVGRCSPRLSSRRQSSRRLENQTHFAGQHPGATGRCSIGRVLHTTNPDRHTRSLKKETCHRPIEP